MDNETVYSQVMKLICDISLFPPHFSCNSTEIAQIIQPYLPDALAKFAKSNGKEYEHYVRAALQRIDQDGSYCLQSRPRDIFVEHREGYNVYHFK